MVFARLDGHLVPLAAGQGRTVAEVVEQATSRVLTGAVSALDRLSLRLGDGRVVRYGDLDGLEDEEDG